MYHLDPRTRKIEIWHPELVKLCLLGPYPCYLVVRLIAISRAYRSGDPDKGHRVGLGD